MIIQELITDYYKIKYIKNKFTNMKQSKITNYFKKKRKFYDYNINLDNEYDRELDRDLNSETDFNKLKKNKIVYGFNKDTGSWHCTQCGIDMGYSNPRQLCKKYYCDGIYKLKLFK